MNEFFGKQTLLRENYDSIQFDQNYWKLFIKLFIWCFFTWNCLYNELLEVEIRQKISLSMVLQAIIGASNVDGEIYFKFQKVE